MTMTWTWTSLFDDDSITYLYKLKSLNVLIQLCAAGGALLLGLEPLEYALFVEDMPAEARQVDDLLLFEA